MAADVAVQQCGVRAGYKISRCLWLEVRVSDAFASYSGGIVRAAVPNIEVPFDPQLPRQRLRLGIRLAETVRLMQ